MWPRLAFALCLLCATHSAAQDDFQYRDRRGGPLVLLPYGATSFADEVVTFNAGDPPSASRSIATEAIGPPGGGRFVSLGCGGILVLRFTNNVLVDVPGSDLYVFEIGPAREATSLAISSDGSTWVDVGRIDGATAEVDIASHAAPGVRYSYVRLTDLRESCRPGTPGADIDAVGAIGAGALERLTVSDAVLFDTGTANLRSDAQSALDALAQEVERRNPVRIFVAGHTDSVGSDRYNLSLSRERAEAVRAYLAQRAHAPIIAVAYGEHNPADTNSTDEGRANNRRVEVLVVPSK